MKTYTHPQETWDKKECAKRAKYAPANVYGDKPPKGIIASNASSYPQYGQTIRFNGGTVIDEQWYKAVAVPLPSIPDTYEFVNLSSWGKRIQIITKS
jgi:hypothetical protein